MLLRGQRQLKFLPHLSERNKLAPRSFDSKPSTGRRDREDAHLPGVAIEADFFFTYIGSSSQSPSAQEPRVFTLCAQTGRRRMGQPLRML
jgi:hypothetical protein